MDPKGTVNERIKFVKSSLAIKGKIQKPKKIPAVNPFRESLFFNCQKKTRQEEADQNFQKKLEKVDEISHTLLYRSKICKYNPSKDSYP